MSNYNDSESRKLVAIQNWLCIIGAILILISLFIMPTGIIFSLVGVILFFGGICMNSLIKQKQNEEIENYRREQRRSAEYTYKHAKVPIIYETAEDIRKKPSLERPEYNKDSTNYKKWEEKYHDTFINKTRYYHKQNDVFYQFDIDYMTFYRSYEKSGIGIDVYYIPQKYFNKAKNYLVNIDIMLNSFCQKRNDIHLHKYNPNDLVFKKNSIVDDFCVLLHHPLTTTGKIAKYPYSLCLRFGSLDISNLEVFFDKYGNFAKGEFCCWHNKQCYLLTASVLSKELQITKAQTNKLGKKEKIFDVKENGNEKD